MLHLTATSDARDLHNRINQTDVAFPADSTICDVWDQVVARQGDAPAVTSFDLTISFTALDGFANTLAHELAAQGTRAGDAVMVSVDRGPALVVALLAILKAGAYYQPIDKSWPKARVVDLAEQTNVRVCIADHELDIVGITIVSPDFTTQTAFAPKVVTGPDDTAYVNFTSGSTGKPKGVPTHHRAVLRLIMSPNYMTLNAETRMLHLAPVCFDAATLEIWGPLLNGGTCVLYPAEMLRLSKLRRLIAQTRINAVFLTTALYNMIMDEDPSVLSAVDCIMTGGEAHSLSHIDAGFQAFGPDKLVSVYGPTETTTYATFYPITRLRHADETALPIGKPIQNTQAFIIADGQLAEEGMLGEVCLAGPGLSHGYLGRPDLNAEKFVQVSIEGQITRVYRTGDLGFWDADGDIVFQGRADDQVKVNGNRIELGEVQHHLLTLPNVQKAAVMVTEADAGAKEVIAFVIAEAGSLDTVALRQSMAQDIPAFMVPNRIIAVESFPLSITGKVDKKALLHSLTIPAIAAE
jgi:amino acid adenylation domain-containing protein